MSKHMLVPMEPTTRMLQAGQDAWLKDPLSHIITLYKAMLAAAPAVQGEPVGWYTEDHLDDKSATTYNAEVAQRWCAKGWPVTPLYTAPQPAEQQPAPDTLIGRTVSMDVSTGDHDAFRRLFGVVTGVEGRDGVILCELTEDNQDVQPAPDVAALVELLAEARDHVVSSTQPVRGGFIDEIDTALTTYRKEGEV